MSSDVSDTEEVSKRESSDALSARDRRDRLRAWNELGIRCRSSAFIYLPTTLTMACLNPELASVPWVVPLVIVVFSWMSWLRWDRARNLAKLQTLDYEVKRRFDNSVRIGLFSWSSLAASVLYVSDGWQIWFVLLLITAMGAGSISVMLPDFAIFMQFIAILTLLPSTALIASGKPYALLGGCTLWALGGAATAVGFAGNYKYWLDLENNRQQMEELASARERLEMVVRGSNLGAFDWLPDVEELFFDQKLAEVLGQEPSRFDPYVGDVRGLIHRDELGTVSKALGRLLKSAKDELVELELPFVEASGEKRWFLFRGRVVQRAANGRATRIAGTYEHITAQKEAEKALELMKERVAEAEKLQTLGVLAGGVAHDFNNLLMAIHGNMELAQLDLPYGSEAFNNLQCAKAAAKDAASLCDQLLAYAGKGKFLIKVLDLSELVEEMVQLLQVTVGRKTPLHMELGEELGLVEGDVSQLRQVIMNLITNAAESMENTSGGTITLRTYRASEEECPELAAQECICLEVRDEGCGMDEDTQRKIFDPFFTTKFTGRGLGLASAQGIARAHHGALLVESEVGKGTCFRFYLPTTELAKAPENPKGSSLEKASPIKILVVDDEVSIRRVSETILSNVGHKVLLAEDGLDALEILGSESEQVNLVLLDLTMPRKDGYQTLLEIRQKWPSLPVVLSSGYSADEVMQKAQADVQGFLKKPFTREQLLEEVDRVQAV